MKKIIISILIIVLLTVVFFSYSTLTENTMLPSVAKNQDVNTSVTNNNKPMKKFAGSYLSFMYPEDWEVEEDEQYGLIEITHKDKDVKSDLYYSIVRSKFERDSIQPYSKFLLEYLPLLDNLVSENKITVSGNLKGVGDNVVVNVEELKAILILSVIHLQMPKPLNEYFDAVTISGYRADTLNGEVYFSDADEQGIKDFIDSIEVVY